MSRRAAWTTIGAIALLLLAFVGALARHYFSAGLPDLCSEEYRRCAAATAGMAAELDCRLEVYHCRTSGEFTHPDGTRVRVPSGPER